MGQKIEDIFYSQACPFDDGLAHHNLWIKCNALKKLLVLHDSDFLDHPGYQKPSRLKTVNRL
jgi:hypothetical protein